MALTIDILSVGVINSTTGIILYGTAASDKAALIKRIVLTNTSTSAASRVHLLLRPASTELHERYITPRPIEIPPSGEFVLDWEITVSMKTTPDQIVGKFDTNSSDVNFVIFGVERDQ